MRTLTGEGEPGKPNLLGGSFGVPGATEARGAAAALAAGVRGRVRTPDSYARGSSGSSGATGGGYGDGGDRGFGRNPFGPVEQF